MTFVLVVLLGAGLVLVVSAIEDVPIGATVRGFINGQVATSASTTTAQTGTSAQTGANKA